MLSVVWYLGAVVSANLLTAHFGPAFSVVSALLFIGATLTTRDALHLRWQTGRSWKMALLIATGSALSWFLNRHAGPIALASFVAFAASESVDAVVFSALHRYSWWKRVNGSNVAGAAVDSIVFPTIAFGGFMPLIVLGQFAAKVAGGAVWGGLLRRRLAVAAVIALVLASSASAQIVSVDAGAIRSGGKTDPVAEVFAASPQVAGFRVFGIGTLRGSASQLSYQAQLTRTIVGSRHGFVSIQGGAMFLPFRDYKPWGMVGLQGSVFIPRTHLSLIAVASTIPADGWSRTYLLKLSATGFAR